jgi:hypothetical protein
MSDASGVTSTRSSLNSIQWFGDFVQGGVSPTDIVLSRVERRLLPPFAFQNCAATPASPMWMHASASVTAPLLEWHRTGLFWSGSKAQHRFSSWLRTDPTMFGHSRLIQVGLGAEWARASTATTTTSASSSSSRSGREQPRAFSVSALRAAAFSEFSASELQSWTYGATFTLPHFPFVQQVALQSSSRNFGMVFLRGEVQRPSRADLVAWTLLPVALLRSIALWLLLLILGGSQRAEVERLLGQSQKAAPAAAPATTVTSAAATTTSSSSQQSTGAKNAAAPSTAGAGTTATASATAATTPERLTAQESIARAKKQKEELDKATNAAKQREERDRRALQRQRARGDLDDSDDEDSRRVIVTWHASASYQREPFFVMLRLNAALPISRFTELSLYADPLRRCHIALCTQLIRNRVDAGMRLRLNTISWKDAALDIGALLNVGSIGGVGEAARLLCIGVQHTGNTLQLFADVAESSKAKPLFGAAPVTSNHAPSNSSSSTAASTASSASSSSWLDFGGVLKSMRCGVILSRFDGGSGEGRGASLGTDFFFRIRF